MVIDAVTTPRTILTSCCEYTVLHRPMRGLTTALPGCLAPGTCAAYCLVPLGSPCSWCYGCRRWSCYAAMVSSSIGAACCCKCCRHKLAAFKCCVLLRCQPLVCTRGSCLHGLMHGVPLQAARLQCVAAMQGVCGKRLHFYFNPCEYYIPPCHSMLAESHGCTCSAFA